jgi:hypothetical protein
MSRPRSSKWIIALTTGAAVAFAGLANQCAFARGGGHGGGHHGGGHHGGHHGGGHHGHHPYHPSHHHTAHHDHHHDHHHYHHHHHSWHHGGWGPGFWGGVGLGALGGWYGGNYWGGGYGGYGGGDTYVDNSSNSTPSDAGTQNPANTSTDPAANQANQQPGENANANGFAVDDWPELGVVTYAGEYGKVQGMVVVRVVPNSSAAKAGIVPGDVILKLNNQPTPNADTLETALDAAKGNFEATVWDVRTGRTSNISGALDAAPADLRNDEDDASGVQPKRSAS